MRKIRLRTRPAVLFGALFVIALIVFLPLRLALGWFGLGEAGLSARAATGSVWAGGLSEARFGDVALGDVRARLSPIQLLVGRARVNLASRQAEGLRGAIGISRHSMGIDDVTGQTPVGAVFAPLPITALDLSDVSIRFRDGQCDHAEGRVRATIMGDAGGYALPALMEGTARCEGGAVLLPLASQAGSEAVALRLWGDGRFRAGLTLQQVDPALATKLRLAGFQPSAQGYQLSVEGRF